MKKRSSKDIPEFFSPHCVKKLVNIRINHDMRIDVLEERKEEYGHKETCTIHSVEGFSIAGNGPFDLSVDFTPVYGREYYLLYAVYSTGDSFSHSRDGGICFIDLYEEKESGEENLKRIQDHYKIKKHGEGSSLILVNESGKKYKIHAPWTGYFESLSCVYIDPVQLNGRRTIWRP